MNKSTSDPEWKFTYPCYHYDAMITVWDYKLYVLGGWELSGSTTKYGTIDGPNNDTATSHLRIFDFSSPSSLDLDKQSNAKAIRIPFELPHVSSATFWASGEVDGKLNLYGGEVVYPPIKDVNEMKIEKLRPKRTSNLWQYDISENNWKEFDFLQKAGVGLNHCCAQSAVDPRNLEKVYIQGGKMSTGQGVYLYGEKGKVDDLGEVIPLSQTLTIDVGQRRVENSTDKFSKYGATMAGQMFFLKGVGEQGVLIILGGSDLPPSNVFKSMRTVYVYDIKSKRWYEQPTTARADVFPLPRIKFCAVVASAPDGSSQNIHIVGGLGWSDAESVAEGAYAVLSTNQYVLSIPSFQWIRLGDMTGPVITEQTCTMLGESRYLVHYTGNLDKVGNYMPEGYGEEKVAHCERQLDEGLINLYDLTELKWTRKLDKHPKEQKYQVPEIIYQRIGGGPNGGATVLQPLSGWANADLQALFAGKPQAAQSASVNINAIIGGVIGGFIGLLILGFGIFRYFPKNRFKIPKWK